MSASSRWKLLSTQTNFLTNYEKKFYGAGSCSNAGDAEGSRLMAVPTKETLAKDGSGKGPPMLKLDDRPQKEKK